MPGLSIAHKGVKYRPDIDGLRAVAVLLVLFFHLGTKVYGGYVGVDVFFVISGYLISSVIMGDFAAGRFSIVSFYERRVRRIIPALLVMLAVTSVLAYRFLIPLEFEEYSRSQLAALFSVSNIFFWMQSGYFDDPSATKPLLHTWSLGVEEQFYIFFPLLLILGHKYLPKWLPALICGCAAASLLAAVLIVPHDPSMAFYLAPLRAWELLIGTILSQEYFPAIEGAAARNIAAVTGILMILYSGFRFTERTQFPGLTALVPCVGAALVIAAGETGGSIVASVLAWRPVVFVGLISYSLYLWHWPLLVFQATSSMLFPHGKMTVRDKAVFVAIAIAVATLSWAFVERPFRTGRFRPGRQRLWLVSGLASGALILISIVFLASQGMPNRFPLEAQKVGQYENYDNAAVYREDVCFLVGTSEFSNFKPDICLAQHAGKKSILLAGDSHAAHLYRGFQAAFPEDDILQATMALCHPFLHGSASPHPACRELDEYLYGDFLVNHRVDLLVLVAHWDDTDMKQLGETIAFIKGKGIPMVVIGPNIEYDLSAPRLIATALRDGTVDRVPQHQRADEVELDRTMEGLAATAWHVPYISIYKTLCKPDCPLYGAPDVPLLWDTNHYTAEGATLLVKAMRQSGQID